MRYCRRCGVAGDEQVPLAPLVWYWVKLHCYVISPELEKSSFVGGAGFLSNYSTWREDGHILEILWKKLESEEGEKEINNFKQY